MKKRNYFAILTGMILLVAATGITSCTTNDFSDDTGGLRLEGEDSYSASDMSTSGGSGNEQGGNTQAGIVTAGEWSDLSNWAFWSKLMLGTDFSEKSSYWQFYTNNRVSVKVTDSKDNALAGLLVKLLRQNDGEEATLWEAVTDNHGQR